jgi:hypothetical protein
MGLVEATLEGARLRFRPIIMTSLAFGFGVLPLAVATGAGAGAQNAIGTGVLGGMVTATVLVIVFAPLFFVIVETFIGKGRKGLTAASGGDKPAVAAFKERLSGIRERLSGKRGRPEAAGTDDITPPEDR